MITIVDDKGLVHLIPRERLITVGMHEATPGVDPIDVKVKLVFLYDTTTPGVGQMVFYFKDQESIGTIKQVLLNWATVESPNQLLINAAPIPPPPAPETLAIDLE